MRSHSSTLLVLSLPCLCVFVCALGRALNRFPLDSAPCGWPVDGTCVCARCSPVLHSWYRAARFCLRSRARWSSCGPSRGTSCVRRSVPVHPCFFCTAVLAVCRLLLPFHAIQSFVLPLPRATRFFRSWLRLTVATVPFSFSPTQAGAPPFYVTPLRSAAQLCPPVRFLSVFCPLSRFPPPTHVRAHSTPACLLRPG